MPTIPTQVPDVARARARADIIDEALVPVLDDSGRIDPRYLPGQDVPFVPADAVGTSVCELVDGLVPPERLPAGAGHDGPDLVPAVDALTARCDDLTDRLERLAARTTVLEQALAALAPTTPVTEENPNG